MIIWFSLPQQNQEALEIRPDYAAVSDKTPGSLRHSAIVSEAIVPSTPSKMLSEAVETCDALLFLPKNLKQSRSRLGG